MTSSWVGSATCLGDVIMESTEYPAMSGSNTICVATVLLETGMIPMEEPVTRFTLEAPAGLIDVECQCRNGTVTSVRFVNQPALVYQLDATIDVAGIGTLAVDIAWGGMKVESFIQSGAAAAACWTHD